MKLILSQYRPAIRLYKWAVTLMNQGYDVTVCYTTELGLGLDWSQFKTVRHSEVTNWKQYDKYISFNPGIGISHNEHIPTIQAVGDLKNAVSLDLYEIDNLQKAEKCIFVSENQMKFAESIAPGIAGSVCHNCMIEELIGEKLPKINNPIRPQYVYSGTITNIKNHHRNIIEQLKQVKANNDCDIHIYPSFVSKTTGHDDFIIHEPVSPYRLVSELSQYDAGLFLLSSAQEVCNMSLPNKYFEYIAAGLPVIAQDFDEIKKHPGVFIMKDFNIPLIKSDNYSKFTKYYSIEL